VNHQDQTDRDRPEIQVELPAGGALVGQVLDPQGQPVPAAQVSTRGHLDRVDSRVQVLAEVVHDGLTRTASRTDAAGRFRLDGLSQGSYRLLVEAMPAVPQHCGPFQVAEGHITETGPIRLAEGAELTGVAMDPMGLPIAGGEVHLESVAAPGEPALAKQLTTDASGRFQATGLAPGVYRLSVRRADLTDPLVSFLDHVRSRQEITVIASRTNHATLHILEPH
jgi:protocatechuate 3,4-dioxygenase beta subunit